MKTEEARLETMYTLLIIDLFDLKQPSSSILNTDTRTPSFTVRAGTMRR